MRRRHQGLDAVAAADFQGHHGAELGAGIFLLHRDGAGDVAAVGKAFLTDQGRPHVGDDRDRVVVIEVEGGHQLDPMPLGIEPAHVEEAKIRAAAAAGAKDPGPDRKGFDIVRCDRGGHAREHPPSGVPAKAGTHLSTVSGSDQWVPAFAGTPV